MPNRTRSIPHSKAQTCQPNPIRLVAVDLDGTLLDDSKQVSSQTLQALTQLSERGVKLIIASARPPRSVRHIYSQLALDTWQINYNGALIWDEPARQVIFHRPIAGDLVHQIIIAARKLHPQILITCEILDRWYTDRFDQSYTTETGRLFKPDIIAPVESFCNQPITKLLFLGSSKIIPSLNAELAKAFDTHVSFVRTDDELIQIMDRKVSKSRALEKVAAHYQIPLSQTMAIGDAPNDVGMIQLAGIGVAMENAHPLAIKAADWIAPSNNAHGVLAALRRYGLCD